MSFNSEDIKKIAHLARLTMSEKDITFYAPQISNILEFVQQMDQAQLANIKPLPHPLNINQRLREDIVTEKNQRDSFQKIAPHVEAGLYLVPKVIE